MHTLRLVPRFLRGGAAALLALAAGSALAAGPAPAPNAPAADKAAPAQVAQGATPHPAAAARPAPALKRNAHGQIESTETRNWAAIDRNGDSLISPDEMQAYLDASRR